MIGFRYDFVKNHALLHQLNKGQEQLAVQTVLV